MTERVGFGPYLFDPSSGELQRVDRADDVVRLSPQPARLLALLTSRAPAVVRRDEIRETLWNGVEVEFDSSLHFCIRQIRAALDETADAPRYIENLPRRGYRFLSPVRPVANDAEAPAVAPPASHRTGRIALGSVAAIAVVAALAFFLGSRPDVNPVTLRIGIYPFAAAGSLTAENLVVRLTDSANPSWAVVGPTTTGTFAESGTLRQAIEELRLDYVFHVREIPGPPQRRLLELIRRDGAHVWVRYLDELPADADPLELVYSGVASTAAEAAQGGAAR